MSVDLDETFERLRAATLDVVRGRFLEALRTNPALRSSLATMLAPLALRIVDSPAIRAAWPIAGPAVRTVAEGKDSRTIEGLLAFGGPFAGADSYGTRFTRATDWGLDLHPAGIPVLYEHGFDQDIGLTPIGMTKPPASFRVDDDGVWIAAELSKRERWYARVAALLDKDALGLSQGSAEHSVRVNAKTSEVLVWPLHEVSLTPIGSNPWNVVSARSDGIRIVAGQS